MPEMVVGELRRQLAGVTPEAVAQRIGKLRQIAAEEESTQQSESSLGTAPATTPKRGRAVRPTAAKAGKLTTPKKGAAIAAAEGSAKKRRRRVKKRLTPVALEDDDKEEDTFGVKDEDSAETTVDDEISPGEEETDENGDDDMAKRATKGVRRKEKAPPVPCFPGRKSPTKRLRQTGNGDGDEREQPADSCGGATSIPSMLFNIFNSDTLDDNNDLGQADPTDFDAQELVQDSGTLEKRGLSNVNFFVTPDDDDRVGSETNAYSGSTRHALVSRRPDGWNAEGHVGGMGTGDLEQERLREGYGGKNTDAEAVNEEWH
ncbi:MAG: hypothetical protein M1839_004311 [Geoglossum umbratile]|nr:MAG: hypothetical protein M1839_004311 [Geoglossum umbratile]